MDDQKIRDRFNNVYEEVFPFIDQKGNRKFNPESVTEENISTLLSWPGRLAVLLAKLTGRESVLRDEQKIDNFNIEQIQKNNHSLKDKTKRVEKQQAEQSLHLKENNEEGENKDLQEALKKNKSAHTAALRIVLKTIYLLHWKTFYIDRKIIETFIRSIAQYFLLMCFHIKYLETKEQSSYLTLEEIVGIVHLNTDSDYYGTSNLGLFWLFFLETVTNKEINTCIKNINDSIDLGSTTIVSKSLLMRKFISPHNQQFSAWFKTG